MHLECNYIAEFKTSRERWWFLAAANCDSSKGLDLYYNLTLLNNRSYWLRHFSADEYGKSAHWPPLLVLFTHLVSPDSPFQPCFLWTSSHCSSAASCWSRLSSRAFSSSNENTFTLPTSSSSDPLCLTFSASSLCFSTTTLFRTGALRITSIAFLVSDAVPSRNFGSEADSSILFACKIFKLELLRPGKGLNVTANLLFLLLLILIAKGYSVTRARLKTRTSVKISIFMTIYALAYFFLYFFEQCVSKL